MGRRSIYGLYCIFRSWAIVAIASRNSADVIKNIFLIVIK